MASSWSPTSPFPRAWIDDRDASDPGGGIECHLIESPFARRAARTWKWLQGELS